MNLPGGRDQYDGFTRSRQDRRVFDKLGPVFFLDDRPFHCDFNESGSFTSLTSYITACAFPQTPSIYRAREIWRAFSFDKVFCSPFKTTLKCQRWRKGLSQVLGSARFFFLHDVRNKDGQQESCKRSRSGTRSRMKKTCELESSKNTHTPYRIYIYISFFGLFCFLIFLQLFDSQKKVPPFFSSTLLY